MNNIVFVIPTLSPGGAEHQVCNQINFLYKNHYSVNLIVLSDKVDLLNLIILPEENITILGLKHLRKTSKLSFLQINTAIKVINNQCNVNTVLISVLPTSHFISRLSKFWFNSKFRLVSYHRSIQYENSPNNTLFKLLFYKVNRFLSKRYDDEHLFISEAVGKHISKYLEVKNGHVIYNALPQKNVNTDLSYIDIKNYFETKPKYLVVIPGRLHHTKGHVFFIESLYDYIRKHKLENLGVMFLGGGPLKNELEEKILKYDIQENIKITDFIKNELLLSYLALSDLVVIPSISEGFGNVAIEALMQSSTILASNAGGLPEIINDKKNGFIFESLNNNDLKQKFTKLHQDKINLNSADLKSDFLNRFTLESQMEKLIGVLRIIK
jgi:glycosyltransferase involved in cell wall biosynthesis